MSQNCQLKRLVDQQDGGVGGVGNDVHMLKKRKLTDNVFSAHTISDSSDEGTGTMSPEPVNLLAATATGKTTTLTIGANPKEIVELKHLLEVERRQKAALEERLRQIEIQLFPDRSRDIQVSYQHQEVIEHTDNVRADEIAMIQDLPTITSVNSKSSHHQQQHHHNNNMQIVSIDSMPATLSHTQVVLCTHADDDLIDEDSQSQSGCEDMNIDHHQIIKQEVVMTEFSRPNSPMDHQHVHSAVVRQPILEAAIKAEPKVEVERINAAPLTVLHEDMSNSRTGTTVVTSSNKLPAVNNTVTIAATIAPAGTKSKMLARQQRVYISTTPHNTSRQNLETIVEAIRHLEGDQMFCEMSSEPAQEVPLALTNKPQRQLQMEMNSFLQFKSGNGGAGVHTQQIMSPPTPTTILSVIPGTGTVVTQQQNLIKSIAAGGNIVSHVQQQQQCRPGVIVVKQTL